MTIISKTTNTLKEFLDGAHLSPDERTIGLLEDLSILLHAEPMEVEKVMYTIHFLRKNFDVQVLVDLIAAEGLDGSISLLLTTNEFNIN